MHYLVVLMIGSEMHCLGCVDGNNNNALNINGILFFYYALFLTSCNGVDKKVQCSIEVQGLGLAGVESRAYSCFVMEGFDLHFSRNEVLRVRSSLPKAMFGSFRSASAHLVLPPTAARARHAIKAAVLRLSDSLIDKPFLHVFLLPCVCHHRMCVDVFKWTKYKKV